MSDTDAAQFTPEEQEWVDAFLAETTLFLGPDPQIMNDHRMAPRTAEEDGCCPARSTRTTWTGCASGSWPAWTRRSR